MTTHTNCSTRLVVAALFIIALCGGEFATAATITVTNNSDTGAGSLRQAISDASSGDEIVFNLSSGNETIVLLDVLTITKSLTLDGSNTAGSGTPITIQVTTPGNEGSSYRLFYVNAASGSVVLQNLSIKGGDIDDLSSPDDKGGAIYHVGGDLTLQQVTITQGHATQGGGIYTDSSGSLVLEECTIDSCGAVHGGAIYAKSLDIHIVRSTLSSNQATLYGGALLNSASGGVTHIVNSTIADNTSVYNAGGGIKLSSGTIYVVNSTITGNSAANEGGGIHTSASTYLYLLNSIVINNSGSSGQDIHYSGTAEARYSWFYQVNSVPPCTQCSLSPYNSSYLESLADNGGPTQTVKVNTNAPAYATGGTLVYYNATDGYYYYDSTNDIYIKMPGGAVFTPSDPSSDVITIDQRGETRSAPQTMGAYHVELPAAKLHAPASHFRNSVATLTLTSELPSGTLAAVDQDTAFDLSSDSSGTNAFFSDAACTTSITQITIPNGSSSATFYYLDDTYGDATITATRVSGDTLGDATAAVRIRGNNAVLLDGTDDYIAADGVNVALNNPTAITVEGWLYPRATGVDMYYFCFNDDDPNERILVGLVGERVSRLSAGGVVKNGPALSADQWHHMAITIAADNSVVVYVDGISTITATVSARPQIDGSFAIGRATNLSGSDKYFNGLIDDVRVWNVARSAAEIRANMLHQLTGNESGLVAYYKLDNGTGTTAYDSVGDADGTLTNGATWATSGAFAGPRSAVDFNGFSQGVLVSDFPKNSNYVSVEAWVYCEDASGSWATIAKNWGASTGGQFHFGLVDASGKLGCGINQSDETTVSIEEAASVPTFPEDQWVHVAFVADGSHLHLYRNGMETAVPLAYDGTLRTNFAPLGIGVKPNDAGTDFAGGAPGYWQGMIDEVRIWNVARTASQIRDNMCKTLHGDEQGLAAYYRFDQVAAADQNKLYDQTLNGNHGTLHNMDPASDWVESTAFVTWIGSVDSAWSTEAANWSRPLGGSPWTSGKDNVGIPYYPTSVAYPEANTPELTGSPNTGHFVLATDATITLSGDATIGGNCFLNDDLSLGTRNFTVNGPLVTTGIIGISEGDLTVDGDFDATGGAVSGANSSEMRFKGDCAFGASFTSNGMIRFNGSSKQTVTGSPTLNAVLVQNTVDASACTSMTMKDTFVILSGTFTGAGDWTYVQIGLSGTLALSDDITVSSDWNNSGTFTHNNHAVTLDGADQTISGSTSFHTLIKTVTTAATLTFPSAETRVTDTLSLKGAADQLLSLRGPSAGTTWEFAPPDSFFSPGRVKLKYLDVADSTISNDNPLDVTDGTSVDSGNNDGWVFKKGVVTTLEATELKATSAKIRCNLNDLGNPTPIQHGIEWVKYSTNDKGKYERTTDGVPSNTGEYVSVITGLQPSTTYRTCAYVETKWGIYEGDVIEFTTPATDTAPDLRVSVSTSKQNAGIGENIDFKVDVQNRGTATASNVTLRFPLPSGTEFVGAALGDQDTSNQSSIFRAFVEGNEIVVVVGDVAASDSLKVNIVLKSIVAGTIELSGKASYSESATPETVSTTANVQVGDVYYLITRGPSFGACGLFGAMLPLLMTFGLLAFLRRSRLG